MKYSVKKVEKILHMSDFFRQEESGNLKCIIILKQHF